MMDASTRLYARLGEIPEDPNDPESLAELLVCAFGAFERYYVCWKTQGGEYRQDGYDLPPALRDWLYPSDGTTRDSATLQVVFGRGEEYFASDKDGKLEYKESESVKAIEVEAKFEKTPLRRTRTVSFLRPLSDVTTRSESPDDNKRISLKSFRRMSRPPSLSYSRTNSDASLSLNQIEEKSGINLEDYKRSSLGKEETFVLSPTKIECLAMEDPSMPRIVSPHHQVATFEVPAGYKLVPTDDTPNDGMHCTCHCHKSPTRPTTNLSYTSSSVQTDFTASPPASQLQVETAAAKPALENSFGIPEGDMSPMLEDYYHENPIFMGSRMTSFFNNPGYQLGDSLTTRYHGYKPMVYEYEEEYYNGG